MLRRAKAPTRASALIAGHADPDLQRRPASRFACDGGRRIGLFDCGDGRLLHGRLAGVHQRANRGE
jgi:hypothetical protein